ncbi:uncharacterized protein [Spinacia oleracea]|uniref:DUF4283 domain-containing protein n=1 Tax=Spinacia oleracea TaxID=3562 RepID=A0ABM3QXE8_SPIOL|nr:uncharacterized protein LOC130463042 [Spinacia oleracea]
MRDDGEEVLPRKSNPRNEGERREKSERGREARLSSDQAPRNEGERREKSERGREAGGRQILTPKSALQHQQSSQVRDDFNAWLNGLQSGNDARSHFQSKNGANRISDQILQSLDNVDNTVNEHIGRHINNLNTEPLPEIVQIELEDIQDEISFWESAILLYVLGDNPPQNVMEGYVRRIWAKFGVDKVSLVGRGLFLVRFTTMENCQKVINGGFQFFDGKPVVVKPWSADMNIAKEPTKKLPIWIQLPRLEVKYWGDKSLAKIVSHFGTMIKVDQDTLNRDKLMFAKVLVEVDIDQKFPNVIQFLNKNGVTRKVWRPKVVSQASTTREEIDKDTQAITSSCFVQATRFSKHRGQQLKPVNTANKFQMLSVEGDNDSVEIQVEHSNEVGLNRKQKQLKVREMISYHKAKLFSLLGTRVKASKMGNLYLNLCPTWCFSTNSSCHNNGRTVIAWDAAAFTIDIIHMTSQVIHCSVTPSSTQESFFCTFVYGLNTAREREALWNTLSYVARVCSTSSWITMGDFNAIMELEDRIGSRVLANSNWGDYFENAEACFLPEEDFDHCPMVLSTHKTDAVKRPFRFYNMWTSSPKFLEIVQTHWCKEYVRCRDEFLSAQKQLHSNPTNCEMATDERDSAEQYRAAKANYDSFMHQRAKLHWLEHGDEKSKAFHQSIKQRRKQNQIYSLQTGDGEWINSSEGVQKAFLDFYSNLFRSSMAHRIPVKSTIVDRGVRLSNTHIDMLDCNFSMEDIKGVLDSIPSNKAPGLDGFNSFFFKSSWDIIKTDLCSSNQDFFRTGKLLKEINVTSITLIPKVSVPSSVSDFRPIACCSVVYKCILKLQCAKLNTVLPDIISPNQGAFVAGRSILHNVLVCQDITGQLLYET